MKIRQSKKPQILVILGPTASGKSELAVKLAQKFNGEIISADSRQIYKDLDIGSGKITRKEMAGIRHHLLDVASPKRTFTVAQYQKLAKKAIKTILAKNKIPIICGGTGFYIDALIYDYKFPKVPPQKKLRNHLEEKTTRELFRQLKKLDPHRAKNIDQHNRRRLIRALEICLVTNQPVPPLKTKTSLEDAMPFFDATTSGSKDTTSMPPLNNIRVNPVRNIISNGASPLLKKIDPRLSASILKIGIKKSPQELKKLINQRLLKRLRQGMIKEVKRLHKSGLSWKRLEEFGLEYRWIARYLQKKITYQQMLEKIQKESEQYAKRQMTWFKRNQAIRWIKNEKEAEKLVKDFLKK